MQTDVQTGDPNILKFLAIGRLAKGSSGGAICQPRKCSPLLCECARCVSVLTSLCSCVCASVARNVGGTEEEKKQTLGKHQVLAYAAASKDERTKIVRFSKRSYAKCVHVGRKCSC